jgi:Leucine-rich repeat (LRR) protein
LRNITNDLPVYLWLQGSVPYFGYEDRRLSTILDVFTNVKGLSINNNGLKDLLLLRNTENIESLDVSYNDIESIESPSWLSISYILPTVKYLDLSHNKVNDVSGLKKLQRLECLNLTGNRIVNVKYQPFSSTSLRYLILDGQEGTALTVAVELLKHLQWLS